VTVCDVRMKSVKPEFSGIVEEAFVIRLSQDSRKGFTIPHSIHVTYKLYLCYLQDTIHSFHGFSWRHLPLVFRHENIEKDV
jgi:hypothetical protein